MNFNAVQVQNEGKIKLLITPFFFDVGLGDTNYYND